VEDHLRFCALAGADPLAVRTDMVAARIGDLWDRPEPASGEPDASRFRLRAGERDGPAVCDRGPVVYQFLVEDGLRELNPVRSGQSGRRGRPRQGLVRRVEQAPWIPDELDWCKILQAVQAEPGAQPLMVALAYNGALRREALLRQEPGDFEPT
jgi:integrase/recombinase XerD